jgi:Tol biopolymer transport system component
MPWALVPGRETLALINAVSLQDANLATLSLGSSPAFARLLEGEGIQSEPSFSPDGAWVVYHDISAVNAFAEINVRPFPAVSRTRIPVGRGQNPVFSRDGSELFFVDGEGAGIAVAAVSYEPTLRIGTPRRLFSASYRWGNFGRTWDIDPNGQRFLMIRNPGSPVAAAPAAEVDASQRPRIDVVVNWVQELESRVPSGGR